MLNELFENPDNRPVNQREKLIFPVFRGEHINFSPWLTLGNQPFVPGPDPNHNPKFLFTMRPEMITQIIRKQFFCVTDVCVIGK